MAPGTEVIVSKGSGGWSVTVTRVVTHGNGPQVGLLALEGASYEEVPAYPLQVLGAETQGMIGYLIEQELSNRLPGRKMQPR